MVSSIRVLTIPRLISFGMFLFLLQTQAVLYAQVPDLRDGVYVVIGVFGVQNNATRYLERVKSMGIQPHYGLRSANRLFYVYDYYSDSDVERARTRRDQLRANPAFYDAWVLYHGLDPGTEDEESEPAGPALALTAADDGFQELGETLGQEEPQTAPAMQPGTPPPTTGSVFPMVFSAINARTLREVPGLVTLVDADRQRPMRQVGTNSPQQVEAPSTQTRRILAVCDIFGYQKQQIEFVPGNYAASPDKEVISMLGDTAVIGFQLIRYPLGSTISMFNVYFYNDATLMRPESRFELNSLLDMLNEDNSLNITIHGHTNTNSAGKIIRLRDDDNNFFEVTTNNIQDHGSAKKLSLERAKVIKRWLEQQGIGENRMKLNAWGGKRMLYDKNDALARRNVRVDIELMKP